jgi:hypothetical protein
MAGAVQHLILKVYFEHMSLERFNSIGWLLILLALASVSLSADDAELAPLVQVEFLAVSLGHGISDFAYQEEGEPEWIYVPSFNLSMPRQYRGPQNLDFFHAREADGFVQMVPAARVQLPLGVSRVLILFGKADNATGLYRTSVLPYTDEAIPANSARVFNFSGRPLPMKLSGSIFNLPSGQSQLVRLSDGQLSVFIPRVNKTVADQANLCNERFSVPQGARLSLIIARAATLRSDDDEALMVIPLIEREQEPDMRQMQSVDR